MFRIFTTVIFSLLFSPFVFSQSSTRYSQLQDYLSHATPPGYDVADAYTGPYRHGNLHYLYPLYQLLKSREKFVRAFGESGYDEALRESLVAAGDNETAASIHPITNDSVDANNRKLIVKTVNGLSGVEQVSAKKYISFIARNYRVIMLNESHDKPEHRAFAVALLSELYKRGFRYLALEMLDNTTGEPLSKLDAKSGGYTTEPVAGDMIRIAQDIGYVIFPYEDTAASSHSPSERDAIQAQHLYNIIKKDSSIRMLVLGGYAHIAEQSPEKDYTPMGMAFRKLSGIDPLTIDQTDMTEHNELPEANLLYYTYTQKFALSEPSIALVQDEPLNISNNRLFDLIVVHPPTTYREGRPTWLTLDGRRQPVYVKPSKPGVFLVQAYYQFESLGAKPGQVVPADQTYITNAKGNFFLYLRRGKYILMFRDMDYKPIYTQHIEVN